MNIPVHRGKVYVGLLGLDQHEAGALSVSRILSDAGFEVVYGGRFNTPETVIAAAIDEDVDVIGLSCHSWEYLYYIDELLGRLRAADKDVPIVLGGSIITATDDRMLRGKGIARTFGSGSTPGQIVEEVSRLAAQSRAS